MTEATNNRRITGSCHCGNIQITFDWPEANAPIPVRACGCGLCTKHRAVWTSHPQGAFSLHIADDGKVSRYRFGTRTAEFLVCQACGIMPISTSEIDGSRYAVVNVHTFDNVDRSELVERPTNFDGETVDNRLSRRRGTWTPEAKPAG